MDSRWVFLFSPYFLPYIDVDLTRYPFHYAEQEVGLLNEERVGRLTLIGRRKLKAQELNSVAKNRRPCSFQAVRRECHIVDRRGRVYAEARHVKLGGRWKFLRDTVAGPSPSLPRGSRGEHRLPCETRSSGERPEKLAHSCPCKPTHTFIPEYFCCEIMPSRKVNRGIWSRKCFMEGAKNEWNDLANGCTSVGSLISFKFCVGIVSTENL